VNEEDYIIECPEKPYFGFFPSKEIMQILVRRASNTKNIAELDQIMAEFEKLRTDLEKELRKKIKAEEKS